MPFRYTLIHKESGVVVDRYHTKAEAERHYRRLPRDARHKFEVVPIEDPRAQRYYERVNRYRIRIGLKPIDPRYPNPQ